MCSSEWRYEAISTVSPAARACSDPASSGAATATVAIPSSRQVRKIRTAISPRFATRSFRIAIRWESTGCAAARSGARSAEPDGDGDEPAGGDPTQHALARLARPDEDGDQLLVAADREAAQATEDESRPAVGAGRSLGRDGELVVRRCSRVHERALHGAATARGDVEADDESGRPARDDSWIGLKRVDQ